MAKKTKNVGLSTLAKLKNEAKAEGNSSAIIQKLDRYAFTGFLRRMASTEWNDFFALKGAMMLLVLTGDGARPTKDIDLDGIEHMETEDLMAAIKEIANTPLEEDDGVRFDLDTLKVLKDRTDGKISGAKVKFDAYVGSSCVKVNIDVGFENVVTPELRQVDFPLQLEHESPVAIQMYPVETSIAEKFRAMLYYGRSNSRMKDFYDVWRFSSECSFDGKVLAEAIEKSCEMFELDVPTGDQIDAFSEESRAIFRPQFKAFTNKGMKNPPDMDDCVDQIQKFLGPVADYIDGHADAPGTWTPEAGWSELEHGKEPAPTV